MQDTELRSKMRTLEARLDESEARRAALEASLAQAIQRCDSIEETILQRYVQPLLDRVDGMALKMPALFAELHNLNEGVEEVREKIAHYTERRTVKEQAMEEMARLGKLKNPGKVATTVIAKMRDYLLNYGPIKGVLELDEDGSLYTVDFGHSSASVFLPSNCTGQMAADAIRLSRQAKKVLVSDMARMGWSKRPPFATKVISRLSPRDVEIYRQLFATPSDS